jgi:hypothetical protein
MQIGVLGGPRILKKALLGRTALDKPSIGGGGCNASRYCSKKGARMSLATGKELGPAPLKPTEDAPSPSGKAGERP